MDENGYFLADLNKGGYYRRKTETIKNPNNFLLLIKNQMKKLPYLFIEF